MTVIIKFTCGIYQADVYRGDELLVSMKDITVQKLEARVRKVYGDIV